MTPGAPQPAPTNDTEKLCSKDHPNPPSAKFCMECGERLAQPLPPGLMQLVIKAAQEKPPKEEVAYIRVEGVEIPLDPKAEIRHGRARLGRRFTWD